MKTTLSIIKARVLSLINKAYSVLKELGSGAGYALRN